MNEFLSYIDIGFNHVLDLNGYDHILFLIVLAVVYQLKQFKKVIWLVSLFTIGHTLTLALSAYGIVKVSVSLVEFLIPVTIFITALFNVLNKIFFTEYQNLIYALFFGLIHGLGFSNYFKMMISSTENKILPLIEFAIGVELAQLVVVALVLVLTALIVKFIKHRYWIIIASLVVMGFSIQMIYLRWLW